jgi:hypothetical protein
MAITGRLKPKVKLREKMRLEALAMAVSPNVEKKPPQTVGQIKKAKKLK